MSFLWQQRPLTYHIFFLHCIALILNVYLFHDKFFLGAGQLFRYCHLYWASKVLTLSFNVGCHIALFLNHLFFIFHIFGYQHVYLILSLSQFNFLFVRFAFFNFLWFYYFCWSFFISSSTSRSQLSIVALIFHVFISVLTYSCLSFIISRYFLSRVSLIPLMRFHQRS